MVFDASTTDMLTFTIGRKIDTKFRVLEIPKLSMESVRTRVGLFNVEPSGKTLIVEEWIEKWESKD